MADLRESFPILEDSATGAGEALISRIEGEASAAIAGSIGFSFKDSSGNVILPQLDASGKIPVTFDATGTELNAHGAVAGSASFVDVAVITAALTKVYSNFHYNVSCLRSAHFQLVHVDDVGVTDTETILCDVILGPGQYTLTDLAPRKEFDTTGLTGVQNIKIKAKNLGQLSDLRGCISIIEV